MNIFLKYFLTFACLTLFLECSSEEDVNTTDHSKNIKYIKTVSASGYSEDWIYDTNKRVVSIVRSNDTMSMYEYDNDGKLIKAATFLRSSPGIKTEAYQLEYTQNIIRIFKKKYVNSADVITEIREYTLDDKGKTIKEKVVDGFEEATYTRSEGNVVHVNHSIMGSVDHLYDNKKNVYYYYPVAFRLVIGDSYVNDNNMIWAKLLNSEQIYNYEYDGEGYVTKKQGSTYTYY